MINLHITRFGSQGKGGAEEIADKGGRGEGKGQMQMKESRLLGGKASCRSFHRIRALYAP